MIHIFPVYDVFNSRKSRTGYGNWDSEALWEMQGSTIVASTDNVDGSSMCSNRTNRWHYTPTKKWGDRFFVTECAPLINKLFFYIAILLKIDKAVINSLNRWCDVMKIHSAVMQYCLQFTRDKDLTTNASRHDAIVCALLSEALYRVGGGVERAIRCPNETVYMISREIT